MKVTADSKTIYSDSLPQALLNATLLNFFAPQNGQDTVEIPISLEFDNLKTDFMYNLGLIVDSGVMWA